MKVLKIILGVLMILGAGSVLASPLESGTYICWIFSVFMFVYGIVSVLLFIEEKLSKNNAKKNNSHIKTGVGSLIFGIAAIVVSVLAGSSVIGQTLFIYIISSIFSLWIILNGISNMIYGVILRRTGIPGWIIMIITGALVTIAGLYCFVNIFLGLSSIGMVFGLSMMMSGFALLFSGKN